MIDPKLWGSTSWSILVTFIHNNSVDIEKCKQFLYLHCKLLPCDECVSHSLQLIELNDILSTTDNKRLQSFITFMYKHTHLQFTGEWTDLVTRYINT